MMINHFILGCLWLLYCALHSLLAGIAFKRKAQQWMQGNYKHYRLLYTFFAFAGLVAIVWYQVQLDSIYVLEQSIITNAIGLITSTAGIIIMSICIGKYFVSLSGIKSLVQETNSHQLIISGVHRYVRHPLYLGTFLFIWGLLLLFPLLSLLITNIIITAYTLVAIRFEENKLVAEFGDEYRRYQQSVPKILPLFKARRSL